MVKIRLKYNDWEEGVISRKFYYYENFLWLDHAAEVTEDRIIEGYDPNYRYFVGDSGMGGIMRVAVPKDDFRTILEYEHSND